MHTSRPLVFLKRGWAGEAQKPQNKKRRREIFQGNRMFMEILGGKEEKRGLGGKAVPAGGGVEVVGALPAWGNVA